MKEPLSIKTVTSSNLSTYSPGNRDHELDSKSRQQTKTLFWTRRTKPDRRSCEKQDGWKPVTLQAPMLGSFILVTLSLIIILEVLSHISLRSSNGGGIAFADDVDSLSASVTFGYLYFPTVLAVCYSLIWSWVDLDVKRSEPWFQLSKSEGAFAKDSILLQYPFDFIPFIPITAFRRKHWSVFFAGTIMLIVFWVITPLQSAIFNTGLATREIQTSMIVSSKISPIEDQSEILNGNFLNTGYAVAWLNQSLPVFTAMDYAIMKYEPPGYGSGSLPLVTETWSAPVDAYSTSLNCTPAIITPQEQYYSFDSGRGCVVSQMGLPYINIGTKYMMMYMGWYSDANVDSFIGSPNCTEEYANNFLAVWGTDPDPNSTYLYKNLTAAFCVTSYHYQNINATVNASNLAVVSPTNLDADKQINLPPNIFNTTHFEYVIGAGISPLTGATTQNQGLTQNQGSDYIDSVVLEQGPQLHKYNLTWPLSNMVGYALALSGLPVESFSSQEVMQQNFEKAHRLLFSTAFSAITIDVNGGTLQSLSGIRKDQPGAILLVRTIAVMVEVALGIIALMSAALWYHSSCRISKTPFDPASIMDIMKMIPSDPNVASRLDNDVLASKADIETSKQSRFRMSTLLGGHLELDSVLPDEILDAFRLQTRKSSNFARDPIQETFVRPLELKMRVGIPFGGLILGSIAAVAFFQLWDIKEGGITLPSSNPMVLAMLENYLPTITATLLEPAWTSFNRFLCVLQPWEELRKGNAQYSKSIGAKYTALPPQFSVWRALRSGHFLLAVLSITAISTNILAVGLSNLFQELPTTGSSLISTAGLPITYQDHFYIELANLTANTTLPAWVDKDFFYIPFELGDTMVIESDSRTIQGYLSSTVGFGSDVECVEMQQGTSNNEVNFEPAADGLSAPIFTYYLLPSGEMLECGTSSSGDVPGTSAPLVFPYGPLLALEVTRSMVSNDTEEGGFCESLLLTGWARATTNITNASQLPQNENTTRLTSPVDSVFIGCTQKLLVASFDLLVDYDGHVLASTQTSPFDNDTTKYFKNNGSSESGLFQEIASALLPPNLAYTWHNETNTFDWINAMLALRLETRNLVDPSKALPAASDIIPSLSATYRQLFAILLGLNIFVFSPASGNQPTTELSIIYTETRIFVSPPMFQLVMVLLVWQFVVAVFFYALRPKPFLTRLPTSIGVIVSYVSASRIVQELQYSSGSGDGEFKEQRFGFGRYIGTDGKTHVGIEKQRFVVPLESENPEVKHRKLGLFKRKTKEHERLASSSRDTPKSDRVCNCDSASQPSLRQLPISVRLIPTTILRTDYLDSTRVRLSIRNLQSEFEEMDTTSIAGVSTTGTNTPTHSAFTITDDSLGLGQHDDVPWAGNAYMIRDLHRGRVITLKNDNLCVAATASKMGGWHWVCEEKNGWLGFRNVVSGTFIGHDTRGRFYAKEKHHKSHEWFCARKCLEGGYWLLMCHNGDMFKKMVIGGENDLVENEQEGTVWEFVKIEEVGG
ncbi:hypothetical protein G7Y89_g13225 [Cudoniella acicularis]|uniref:Uncharacterized protein n=1 Tax=Cudoniella acicularis TaxID=354080 RepID=A0A8H4R8Y9_9HELO|nr:hypothetical protein G7Y89_g13225 [Cudoniella acicularis]